MRTLTQRLIAAAAALLAACVIVPVVAGIRHRRATVHELLTLPPDQVAAHPALLRFAAAQGAPLYAANCAACHGAHLEGSTAAGAPNLADPRWLYGAGRVSDIERTILFGIRSGHGKARNEAEMPAFGQAGILAPTEITALTAYLQALGSHTPQPGAAEGRAVYTGRGGCADCHGRDARGSTDLGSPDLTTGRWNHGGSRDALYASLFYGLHSICPAWQGRLDPAQIRILAVYVYAASHPS